MIDVAERNSFASVLATGARRQLLWTVGTLTGVCRRTERVRRAAFMVTVNWSCGLTRPTHLHVDVH